MIPPDLSNSPALLLTIAALLLILLAVLLRREEIARRRSDRELLTRMLAERGQYGQFDDPVEHDQTHDQTQQTGSEADQRVEAERVREILRSDVHPHMIQAGDKNA